MEHAVGVPRGIRPETTSHLQRADPWRVAASEELLLEGRVVVSRRRDGEVIRDIQTATLGPGSNELCAKIPLELSNVPDLTIRGSANYALRHGLWIIWQELPAIPVPPL